MATHDSYFQEFVAGAPSGGVFLAARGEALLLGVTRQLVGSTWAGANNLQYVGSVGPVLLENGERQAWETTGACLASRFALTGLFGVDAIVNEDGVFVIEVNPRYTASVELLERAGNWSALALQKLACVEEHGSVQNLKQDFQQAPQSRNDQPATKLYGKAIVYATKQTRGSDGFWSFVAQANSGEVWPMAADLPNRGEAFQPGQPVLTVFAEGANESQVTQQLQVEASRVQDLL
jgi:predicted ATP-grasp superfamily ATP-dependent carboligase